MMGRLNHDQGQLYSFCLVDAVPDDHPIREIAAVLDLTWIYSELAPTESNNRDGRRAIKPPLDNNKRRSPPNRSRRRTGCGYRKSYPDDQSPSSQVSF